MITLALAVTLLVLAVSTHAALPGQPDRNNEPVIKLKKEFICRKLAMMGKGHLDMCQEFIDAGKDPLAPPKMQKEEIYFAKVNPKIYPKGNEDPSSLVKDASKPVYLPASPSQPVFPLKQTGPPPYRVKVIDQSDYQLRKISQHSHKPRYPDQADYYRTKGGGNFHKPRTSREHHSRPQKTSAGQFYQPKTTGLQIYRPKSREDHIYPFKSTEKAAVKAPHKVVKIVSPDKDPVRGALLTKVKLVEKL